MQAERSEHLQAGPYQDTEERRSYACAIEADLQPSDILAEGMIWAMREVGKRVEEGESYLPEMLVVACAMQAALSFLKPSLMASDDKSAARVAIGTVKGDLHDIEKNLVKLMLEGAGFDVSPERFVEAISAGDVEIVALSAVLTTTLTSMKTTIEAIEQACR